jgi:hypothetical protein
MTIPATVVRQVDLDGPQREELLDLHRRYYANVKRESFHHDLCEKDWVILLRDQDSHVVGFSTVQEIHLDVEGSDRRFLFSGDTIVQPDYWFSSSLAGAFGQLMLRRLSHDPGTPLYWFLISKGYRTYRYLPVYFREFGPSCLGTPSPHLQRLLEHVARVQFGEHFDPKTGIIKFNRQHDCLRPELCDVSDRRAQNRHIRFFLDRNPGYARGDELACIAEISEDNLRPTAFRAIKAASVEWCV